MTRTHLQSFPDRVRMSSQSETMESGEAMAVAALLPGRCSDREPRHTEVGPGGQRARVGASTTHVQLQERLPTLLALMVSRRRQQRARKAVALRAWRRGHLFFRLKIRPFRSRFITFRIRRRRWLANHIQRRPSIVGDGWSGHIPRLVQIRDEASYVHILVVSGWSRKVRRQGHVSGRIIRRARCTASCDRFVSVVTMSRYEKHDDASRVTISGRLFRARLGAGREEGGRCEWTRPADTYKWVGAEGTQREALDKRGGGAVSGSFRGQHVARSPARLCRPRAGREVDVESGALPAGRGGPLSASYYTFGHSITYF